MEEFEDSEAYFDEQRSKFFDAMIPLFDFSSFHAGNIIDYAQTLLRISGMEVGGWDPYAESRNILEDLNGFFKIDLPEERFPNRVYTDWRIGLLMYCHIV
ncbi:MAG: hypothetical protein JWL86_2404, partial [Rhizobium sp.]|nr:hypothetical protein [Rhizobium sp.]